MQSYWTAAVTRYAQEQRAAHHVERQGFQYYLPEFLTLTTNMTERRELLFPGYIFIRIVADAWQALMGTRGISRVFTTGTDDDHRPSRLPRGEIEELISRHDARGFVQLDPPLAPGSDVKILEGGGAYVGLRGIVQGTSVQNRCTILLSVMGRMVAAEFDRRVLEATTT